MSGSTSPWRLASGSRATGPDPLHGRLFALAISVNYLPAALGGTEIELGVLAVFHLVVIARIRACRSAAAKQRALDLERFTALAGQASATSRVQGALSPRS